MNLRSLQAWIASPGHLKDPEGCLFLATVRRKSVEELNVPDIGASKRRDAPLSGHTDPLNDLLNAIRRAPSADYRALALALGVSAATVKRNIQKLKQQTRIRRAGSKKTGYWEVLES